MCNISVVLYHTLSLFLLLVTFILHIYYPTTLVLAMYKYKYRYTKEIRGEADNVYGWHGEMLYTVAATTICENIKRK